MISKVLSRAGCLAAGTALGLGLGLGVSAGAGATVATQTIADTSATTPSGGCTGPTVTATGSGVAYGTPNLLTMQIGVQTTEASARAALSRNNTLAQALITTLEHGGVQAKYIQTSNLSINPTYSGGKNPKVTGYQVEDDLTVQIYQLSSAGSLIDTAAAQLGNDVTFDGLSFSVSNPSGPSAAASANAVQEAVVEAKAMAQAAGSTLGALCSINNTGSSSPEPVVAGSSGFANQGAALPSVPVQAGTEQFTAQVTVTYRLG